MWGRSKRTTHGSFGRGRGTVSWTSNGCAETPEGTERATSSLPGNALLITRTTASFFAGFVVPMATFIVFLSIVASGQRNDYRESMRKSNYFSTLFRVKRKRAAD
jgi:hypothetical protein